MDFPLATWWTASTYILCCSHLEKNETQLASKIKGWKIQSRSCLMLVRLCPTGQVYMERRCKGRSWREWSSCFSVLVGWWFSSNTPILRFCCRRLTLKLTIWMIRLMLRRDVVCCSLPCLLFFGVVPILWTSGLFVLRSLPRNPRVFFWLLGVGELNVSPSNSLNCLVLVLSFLSPAVLLTWKLWNFHSLMEMGPSSCQKKGHTTRKAWNANVEEWDRENANLTWRFTAWYYCIGDQIPPN